MPHEPEDRPFAGAGARRSPWPMVAAITGIVVATVGVVLNENEIDLGQLLVIVGVPVAFGGIIYAVLGRQLAGSGEPGPPSELPGATATLADVASRLRLSREGGNASGVYRKRRVELSCDDEDGPITVRALATRELDMGLSVMRGRPPGDARKEVSVGDDEFDAAYVVRADEPERAQQILSDRLRELLLSANAQLDDRGVQLQVPPGVSERVVQSVRLAVKAAAELDRVSPRVPCVALMKDARDAWLEYAQDAKLASTDTPLSIWGDVDGLRVSAVVVRDAFQNYHFEVKVDFPEPLGRGLELKPASSTTQWDRSGEPVGHPAFDKIFVLKAHDPIDATRLMGPDTRDAILELRDGGVQLRAVDSGLWAWVGFIRTDPDVVPRGLIRMVQIARRIADNAARFPLED